MTNSWEMSTIKIKKIFSWVLLFYMAVSFIECIILTVVAYAGWNGFGGVTMEYTKMGERCVGVLIFLPLLLLLGVFACRLMRFHREKKATGFYIMEFLRCITGIGIGIAAFCLLAWCDFLVPAMVRNLQHRIENSDWMCWPIP